MNVNFSELTETERRIGAKRFGLALYGSMQIQNLKTRSLYDLTKRIYGVGVDKNSVSDICRGFFDNISIDTLRRLTPIMFEVRYFKITETDLVGTPVFKYRGENYKGSDKNLSMKFVACVPDLPDIEYRCTSRDQLTRILCGEIEFKRPLILQSA